MCVYACVCMCVFLCVCVRVRVLCLCLCLCVHPPSNDRHSFFVHCFLVHSHVRLAHHNFQDNFMSLSFVLFTHTRVHGHTHRHIHTQAHTHTHTHTHTHVHGHTCTHDHTHAYTRCRLVPTLMTPTDVARFAWYGKPGGAKARCQASNGAPEPNQKRLTLIEVVLL